MKKEKAAARIFFSSPLSLANYFDGLLLSKFLFPAALQPFVMLQWLINHNCRKRLSLFIWVLPHGTILKGKEKKEEGERDAQNSSSFKNGFIYNLHNFPLKRESFWWKLLLLL